MSHIIVPRRSLILPRRVRQQQGGFIMNPFAHAAPASIAHRYWRILITATDSSAVYAGFTEIELRGSVGGANLLSVQAGNGAALSSRDVNGSNAAWRAADGSNTSGWLADLPMTPFPQWWRYDFGHAWHVGSPTADVRQVLIRGSHNVPGASPEDFQLQWSDDNTTWTTVMTVTGQTGWTGASDARTFNVP